MGVELQKTTSFCRRFWRSNRGIDYFPAHHRDWCGLVGGFPGSSVLLFIQNKSFRKPWLADRKREREKKIKNLRDVAKSEEIWHNLPSVPCFVCVSGRKCVLAVTAENLWISYLLDCHLSGLIQSVLLSSITSQNISSIKPVPSWPSLDPCNIWETSAAIKPAQTFQI